MRRRLLLLAPLLAALLTIGPVDASFTADAPNDTNVSVAATVATVDGFAVDLVTNAGGLDCTATLDWIAVSQVGVTGMEIERVRTSTNEVLAGPVLLAPTATGHIATPIPLQGSPQEFSWRIRTRIGAWSSAWELASEPDPGACV